jgi:hypothetical protein
VRIRGHLVGDLAAPSGLMTSGVGVEKVDFSENQPEMGDQKCIGGRRRSFIGHPSAMFFEHDFCERVFQQAQDNALIEYPQLKSVTRSAFSRTNERCHRRLDGHVPLAVFCRL